MYFLLEKAVHITMPLNIDITKPLTSSFLFHFDPFGMLRFTDVAFEVPHSVT